MRAVLVVDDDEAIRQAIRMVLDDKGYYVVEAANGEEALRAMRASKAGIVVLLDLMMPRMGGREVLEAMEAEPTLSWHAVILMTAGGRTLPLAVVQQMGNLGVTLIGKPFDIDDLIQVVTLAAMRLDARGAP